MRYEEIEVLENEDLVRLYKNGTKLEQQYAMEVILKKNERLITHLIGKYYSSYRYNHYEDLMNAGREALFLHAPDYDPDRLNPETQKPYRFSTFISSYIVNALKLETCDVHNITPHYAAQIKKLKLAMERLQARGVENPTLDMLAEEIGVGVDAVQRAYELSCQVNLISIEGDKKDENLCDSYYNAPDAVCERKEFERAVATAVQALPEDEYRVIQLSYLASTNNKEVPLSEVAKKLGKDVPTVRRLKNQAMRRLKENPLLQAYANPKGRDELDDYMNNLDISFVISSGSINLNLDIAMSLDELDEENLA